MDGFDQDKHKGQRDERGIVLLGFLAPHGHPLEALGLADQLLGAGPQLVKPLWEEPRLALDIGPVRNDRRYPSLTCGVAVCLGVIALVGDDPAWRHIRTDVEQDLELPAVAGFVACEMKVERQALEVALDVNFGAEPAT